MKTIELGPENCTGVECVLPIRIKVGGKIFEGHVRGSIDLDTIKEVK